MARVRGEGIKELIREGIKRLSIEAEGKYIYNASQLSAQIGVSRPTLYSYGEFIDEVLRDIKADKKFAKGHAVIEFMREKVTRVEDENQRLKKEVDALRKHHAEIFGTLYASSANLAALVKPVVVREVKESGCCTLCLREVDATAISSKSKKVIDIAQRRDKGK